MVPGTGIAPAHLSAEASKTSVSTVPPPGHKLVPMERFALSILYGRHPLKVMRITFRHIGKMEVPPGFAPGLFLITNEVQ